MLRGDDIETEAERRRLVRLLAAAVVVSALLCLFGVVVFHVVLTQNQFRLDSLQNDALDRQARYDRLRLDVAELESPDRIVADAQRLGLVTPDKVTYLAPVIDGQPASSAADAASRIRPSDDPAGAAAGTGWSVVKPHLADG